MIETIWYCPNCDKPTANFEKCSVCKGNAILQTFQLWPISNAKVVEPEEEMIEFCADSWEELKQKMEEYNLIELPLDKL